ncbi:MAG: arylesterase [Chromatiales bacterium]|nr:arylesterase [Chromatiales bacterium]
MRNRRARWRLVWFAALLLGAADAMAQRPVLLVLGDSLSAGYGLADLNDSWVALLAGALHQRNPPWDTVNASISGETTSAALDRVTETLIVEAPTVVLIALGANDGLRGLPPAGLSERLQSLARFAKAAGATPVIAGVRLPLNYGPVYAEKFAQAFRDAATAEDAALIENLLEGVDEKRGLFQDDGLHPATAAQPVIAKHMGAALAPVLDQTSSAAP